MDRDQWEIPAALRARMTEVARQLRRVSTRSEAMLWRALRGRGLDGCRFRRQEPIGPFVVDFLCASERLIVEVDGPIHETQREADAERQQLLESLGFRFLRVQAAVVEKDLPSVLASIREALKPRSGSSSPCER